CAKYLVRVGRAQPVGCPILGEKRCERSVNRQHATDPHDHVYGYRDRLVRPHANGPVFEGRRVIEAEQAHLLLVAEVPGLSDIKECAQARSSMSDGVNTAFYEIAPCSEPGIPQVVSAHRAATHRDRPTTSVPLE